jgi:hypothetical protein
MQLTRKSLQISSADLTAGLHWRSGGDLLPIVQSLEKVTWPDILECRQLSTARRSKALSHKALKHEGCDSSGQCSSGSVWAQNLNPVQGTERKEGKAEENEKEE